MATGSPIGKPIRHVAWGGAFPAIDTFQGLVFSPDGKRILTASYENTAHLWDAATGEPIGDSLKHTPDAESRSRGTRVRMVAFSPDGSQIVTASGSRSARTVRRWDAATLQPIGEPFQQGKPEAIAFCPDGLCVLTSAYRDGGEEGLPRWDVELWNVDRSEALGPAVDSTAIYATAIAPDGATLQPRTMMGAESNSGVPQRANKRSSPSSTAAKCWRVLQLRRHAIGKRGRYTSQHGLGHGDG